MLVLRLRGRQFPTRTGFPSKKQEFRRRPLRFPLKAFPFASNIVIETWIQQGLRVGAKPASASSSSPVTEPAERTTRSKETAFTTFIPLSCRIFHMSVYFIAIQAPAWNTWALVVNFSLPLMLSAVVVQQPWGSSCTIQLNLFNFSLINPYLILYMTWGCPSSETWQEQEEEGEREKKTKTREDQSVFWEKIRREIHFLSLSFLLKDSSIAKIWLLFLNRVFSQKLHKLSSIAQSFFLFSECNFFVTLFFSMITIKDNTAPSTGDEKESPLILKQKGEEKAFAKKLVTLPGLFVYLSSVSESTCCLCWILSHSFHYYFLLFGTFCLTDDCISLLLLSLDVLRCVKRSGLEIMIHYDRRNLKLLDRN